MVRCWQHGGCRVASVGRDQRLSGAGHKQFQPAPVGPLQDTAETLSQVCGASLKTYLRKGKKHQRRRERIKRVRKSRGNTQVQAGGGGGGVPWWSRSPHHSWWKTHTAADGYSI